MELNYEVIKEQLKRFIQRKDTTEEEFNQMALSLFAYQYEQNQGFRKYCRKRRVSPSTVTHYTQIPPVPIAAFKQTTLSCSSVKEAEAIFMTSGTTNPELRGKNIHRDLEVYDLSMKTHFQEYILPDIEKVKMAVLFPTEKEMPNSSLAHYLQLAYDWYGTEDSEYVVSKDGFEQEILTSLLRKAEQENEPVLLIGATFSFVHYLDYCAEQGIHFSLPAGSRVMDTGGAKGKSREIEPRELKSRLSQLFAAPEYACLNMYGMTELSSQFYDNDWHNHLDQHDSSKSSAKVAPHWVRTLIVDPETMRPKSEGEQGIIIHYDLANLNSVCAIMTEDIGISEGEGFHLLGRAAGAEAKGCSLAVEQFLTAVKGEKEE